MLPCVLMESALSYVVWGAVRLFFRRDARTRVSRVLVERCGSALPGASSAELVERIRLAVLKITEGDEEQLVAQVAIAEEDFRDVLVTAGFESDTTAHIQWATEALKLPLAPPEPPRSCGEWLLLTPSARKSWLDIAADRALGRYTSRSSRADSPQRTTFVLPGACITDLTSFLCAVGEAVNGPGGYFGSSLTAFEDCLAGGFGASLPSIFRWRDAHLSRQELGHEPLAAWAAEQLSQGDFLDQEGEAWLRQTLRDAGEQRGPTMFDTIVALIVGKGHQVELDPPQHD